MQISPKTVPHVAIVSGEPDTVRGLRAYFERAGVPAEPAPVPLRVEALPERTTTIVMFPDDLDPHEVQESIARVQAARPEVLLIVVTSAPRAFERSGDGSARSEIVVLPRPAFGWTILDAVRARADG